MDDGTILAILDVSQREIFVAAGHADIIDTVCMPDSSSLGDRLRAALSDEGRNYSDAEGNCPHSLLEGSCLFIYQPIDSVFYWKIIKLILCSLNCQLLSNLGGKLKTIETIYIK